MMESSKNANLINCAIFGEGGYIAVYPNLQADSWFKI